MAIEAKTGVEDMSASELETALGVPGAATDWRIFGDLMIEHRIGLHPTSAWGQGNGVASNTPGWLASIRNMGTVVIENDPLIAGCKCLILELQKRK